MRRFSIVEEDTNLFIRKFSIAVLYLLDFETSSESQSIMHVNQRHILPCNVQAEPDHIREQQKNLQSQKFELGRECGHGLPASFK